MILLSGDNYSRIKYIDIYHPWWSGNNPNWNSFSASILDVKNKRIPGYDYFKKILCSLTTNDQFTICTVPSSTSENINHGIACLARLFAIQKSSITDGTACLIRHTSVDKSHNTGNRNIDKHITSIRVERANLIIGQDVLLLDDVTTSGASLNACKQILSAAGAKNVQCLALGKTG